MPNIHPTAVVAPEANIADDVEIGPLCVVGPNVTMGAGCRLIAQCHIAGHTTLGERNTIYPMAVIGCDPQDYGFEGAVSYVQIGNDNVFREGFTVNPGTKPDTETVIGDGCYLMIGSHVAHNCKIGNKVIMVNNAGASGYVEIGDNCLISGLCGIHQFCHVGRFAVMSGGSFISRDLPPFMVADGRNGAVRNINLIGLKRNGFSPECIRALKNVYKIFYRSGLNIPNALAKIREDVPQLPEVVEFIEFVEASERGVLAFGENHGRRG